MAFHNEGCISGTSWQTENAEAATWTDNFPSPIPFPLIPTIPTSDQSILFFPRRQAVPLSEREALRALGFFFLNLL
jgi:hypothetical protein